MTAELLAPTKFPELSVVPRLFADEAGHALRFLEFFTANIRNANTRAAYAHAARRFSDWCETHGLRLPELSPLHVAAYVEQLGQEMAPPSVKQHLAALRMLFDFLVLGHIIRSNPASSVRGPKYVVKAGKTPALTGPEARSLLEGIAPGSSSVCGLRDRALIGVMLFAFARVGAAVGMDVSDYRRQETRAWLRLHEKGGKFHEVPAHHKAQEYLDAYLAHTALSDDQPLFQTVRAGGLTGNRLSRREALDAVKRRAIDAGLGPAICCHSFRATGITVYLHNHGTLEKAQALAAHESPRTTKLYDRSSDQLSLDEVEKIIL